ncbi:MAG: hypothetical protein N3A38_10855 [Planctomycetota bacterium]|nr:hypothetical protein [Planctomycetota bacterium]
MFRIQHSHAVVAALLTASLTFFLRPAACFADTVVMVDGKELECTLLGEDEDRVEVEVEFGTIQIPRSRILRIERDDPEVKARKEAERKARAEAEAKFAEEQRAKGLVLVDGKWVTPAEAAKMEETRRRRAEEAAKKAAASRAKTERKEEDAREKEEEEAGGEKASKKGKDALTALQEELLRSDRGHRRTSRYGTSRSSRSSRSRGSYGRGSSIYSGSTLYGYSRSSGSRTGIRNHYYGDYGIGTLSPQDRARLQQLLDQVKGSEEGD